jgi:GTPase SAR1 family protein
MALSSNYDVPAVLVDDIKKDRVDAVAAFALSSVMSADLLTSQGDGAQDESENYAVQQWRALQALLQAVAVWPKTVVLELHWCALPDMQCTTQGLLWVTLFIRSWAKDKETAIAQAVQGCFRLQPLLVTLFPYLTFKVITDNDELLFRFRPFEPVKAVQVKRRRERIALSHPISIAQVGFAAARDKSSCVETVTHCYPWLPLYNNENNLIRALMVQMDPIELIVRIKPCSPSTAKLKPLVEMIRTCETFLSAGKQDEITLAQQVTLLRDISLVQLACLNESGLAVGVYFVSSAVFDPVAGSTLAQLILSTLSCGDSDHLFRGGFSVQPIPVDRVRGIEFIGESPVTIKEAAAVFRLPLPPRREIAGLPVRRWRTASAASHLLANDSPNAIVLFDNDHHGQRNPIVMGNDDRMRHMVMFGQTGCGKSTLMEQMILNDIRRGYGVAVIDPHGDTVESLLEYIPEERAADVVLFDVLDRERPIGFNLLAWQTTEERDMIIDELYGSMDMMYDMKQTGGPIFENNLRNMLKLLMGDGSELRNGFIPTVIDFTGCYLDDEFRQWLVRTIDDDEVISFVKELERPNYGEAQLRNMAPYITSKFGRFSSDITLKRVFGQRHSCINFDRILGEQKILLVKLGRGRFGSAVCSLLASQLLLRLKLAAMKRGDLSAQERKDFFLYVDEAGLIPGHSLGDLLSEARKFRLGVVLASQYSKQMTHAMATARKDTLLDSVYGNVGATILFRLGKEDAKELSTQFWPEFSSLDIMRLPNYCGYAKMQLGNQPTPPFSFKTRPIDTKFYCGLSKRIKRLSRHAYGAVARDVDKQISLRNEFWKATRG